MKYELIREGEPRAGDFWLVKTPNGMEGMVFLYIDYDFGEAEVIIVNAFELGTVNRYPDWINLKDCDFQGCVRSDINYAPDGIKGGYNVDLDKSDVDAAFTILEISNTL